MSSTPRRSDPTTGSRRAVETPSIPPAPFGLLPEEWHLLVTAHSNVLVEGPEAPTAAVILALTPHLDQPIHYWQGGPPTSRPASLVIREMTALTLAVQRVLLHWIESPGERVRVIAMSSQPLFPLIERGLFLADLYYRLNVLRVELERR